MDARTRRVTVRLVAVLLGTALLGLTGAGTAMSRAAAPQAADASRIVSLVPNLTEALFAIGAGSHVVGVSTFDSFPPEVRKLPRVGALLDPNTERILALRPTLVILYGSQSDARSAFERAGIKTFSYRHGGIREVLEAIRDLGASTSRVAAADALVRDVRARIDAVHRRVAGLTPPRTLLVIDRQPQTLRNLYVSGGIGFMHEMLEAAGGRNVFAGTLKESVQPSQETLLARAPEVIIEVRAAGMSGSSVADERSTWAPLASIPAVRNKRIFVLVGDHLVVPGPRMAQGIEALAKALHPAAFAAAGQAR